MDEMNTTDLERIQQLELRHRDLDAEVARLGRRAYLTPLEQHEVARMKKEKLLAKDLIAALRR
jgi:uncharacterized protein YdcH (DUF465 family)